MRRRLLKSILAFGELLWDLLPDRTVLGGAVFNCAYRLATLGNRVRFAGRIGNDELGRRAADEVVRLGLDLDLLQIDADHPTGMVSVTLHNGVPDFYIVPEVAYDFIETDARLLAAAAEADALVFGTLIQRSPRSRATLAAVIEAAPRVLKFLDLNLRRNCYSEETVRSSLAAADLLKLNEDEVTMTARLLGLHVDSAAEFAGAMIDAFALECVIVTLGEKGVFASSAAGEQIYEPGYRVETADTVGAGDACAAGFLHAYLGGESLRRCCALGNALGALVAATHGATAKVEKEEIDELFSKGGERIVDPQYQRSL